MEKKYDKKILITGVHSTPALAVLDELQKRGYRSFVWIGQKYTMLGNKNTSLEYQTIKAKNIRFRNLITGKIQRTLDISFFKWIIRIPIGFIQALFIIIREKPSIVITFGSHVGVPISFWAWLLRIPVVDHEQTVTQSLSNSIISKFANKVCFSWKGSHKESKKYIYTGNPIRKDILNSTTKIFKFTDGSKRTILFTAGNQGSHKLNLIILSAIENLSKKYNVIHQTGTNPIANDFETAQEIASKINSKNIRYIPIINFNGGEAYKKADLVVSRSGANTVYDIAALEKVAVFIPLPFTRKDEQTKNAKLLSEAGTAVILYEKVLTVDTLIATIDDVFANYDSHKANTKKAKNLITLDADKKIADIVENILKKRNFFSKPKVISDEKEKFTKAIESISKNMKEYINQSPLKNIGETKNKILKKRNKS